MSSSSTTAALIPSSLLLHLSLTGSPNHSSRADPQLVNQANRGEGNPHIRGKVRIVRGMVEDKAVQADVLRGGKVDTIVSEPIGVMLLHERMVSLRRVAGSEEGRFAASLISWLTPIAHNDCVLTSQVESFLLARDMFLKPGGSILPSSGSIFFSPFSDEGLYNETEQKVSFDPLLPSSSALSPRGDTFDPSANRRRNSSTKLSSAQTTRRYTTSRGTRPSHNP